MTDKETEIAKARDLADQLREAMPDKAAEIERRIAEFEAGQRDGLNITASIQFRLEKYEGDFEPGKKPYEVIEGEDRI